MKTIFDFWMEWGEQCIKDTEKFMDTALVTEGGECYDEYEIVHEDEYFNIVRFQDGPGPKVVMRPPTSGHGCLPLISMGKGKSMIETTKKALPNSSIYAFDYHPATHRDVYLEHLVGHVGLAIKALGNDPVHLVGLCQGGYPLTCYTALEQERVLSLVLMASPQDFHIGKGYFYDLIQMFGVGPVEAIIDAFGGVMPGPVMLFNFMMMNPMDRFLWDYMGIWKDVFDGKDDELAKKKAFRKWYYGKLYDLHGGWVVDVNRDLFLYNKMIKGELEIFGQTVDPSKIDIPVGVMVGTGDDITPRLSALEILNMIASREKVAKEVPVGHIGLYVAGKSQGPVGRMMQWMVSASERHIEYKRRVLSCYMNH